MSVIDISNSYVIDQGYFRNKDLFTKIKSSAEGEFFIVTEDALVEMFKSDEWEKISIKSLSIIKNFYDKILVTNPIGLLREREIESKKACHDFVDIQSTMLFRMILESYKKGNIEEINTTLRENILMTQEYKSSLVLNHERNKELYIGIVKKIQDQMGPSLRNDLRKNKVSLENIYQLIIEGIEECFRYPSGEFGLMKKDELENFINNKPIHYFLYAALLYESFYWQQKLGVDQMKPKKVTNYILDSNYITVALYSKSILSNDVLVNETYKHLRKIGELKFGQN